ncbi:TPA: hypothetical protein ACH3X2_014064 [Trebouxia sp. C0005]
MASLGCRLQQKESVYSDKAEQAFQPTYLEGLQVSPEQQRSLFDIGFDLKAMQSVHSLEDHNQQEALESARSCPSMTTHGSRIVQRVQPPLQPCKQSQQKPSPQISLAILSLALFSLAILSQQQCNF